MMEILVAATGFGPEPEGEWKASSVMLETILRVAERWHRNGFYYSRRYQTIRDLMLAGF